MKTRTTIILLAVLLGAPAAAAGWGAKGIYEPDTERDRLDGYMRDAADTVPTSSPASENLVYFNAFSTHSAGFHAEVATSVNPNLASLETGYITSAGRAVAMLGVWKDCNKDGFVGWGDNGLWEYRAELLLVTNQNGVIPGTSVCPSQASSMFTSSTPRGWAPIHNDGAWIHEFLPIGYDNVKIDSTGVFSTVAADNNPWNFIDQGARVWWDWGLPADPAHSRCYIFAPKGSLHTTGGLLAYIDCFLGFRGTDGLTTAGNAGADNTPAGQISFKDNPRDQGNSDSALNIDNPWGEPNGGSHVTAFDCGQPAIASVSHPATEYKFRVSQPRSPTVQTTGSLGGTANATQEATEDCDGAKYRNPVNAAEAPYGPEHNIFNTRTTKKNTDFTLTFVEGFRNAGLGFSQLSARAGGSGTPRDLGTRATDVEGLWLSTSVIGEDHPAFYDREAPTAIRGVTYTTAYAKITKEAIDTYGLVVKGTPGVYGAEHCGVPPAGDWECDRTKWWKNDDGTPSEDTTTDVVGGAFVDVAARVGDEFVTRDIDCYDFSAKPLRQQTIHWGVLTNTYCRR